MVSQQLSASSENYLKAVWTLQEWSDEPVTPTRVAAKVGVRLSTASDAVRKLADQGYLVHSPYGAIALTEQGVAIAVTIVRRHRLIETFLAETLGYHLDEVHTEAEVLEHDVSDLMIERIDAHLGCPERDPHGDPIPRADGSMPTFGARPLSELVQLVPSGTLCRIERVGDEDPELLRFLAERHVVYGAEFTVCEAPPYSDDVALRLSGSKETLSLGAPASRVVWACPLADSGV